MYNKRFFRLNKKNLKFSKKLDNKISIKKNLFYLIFESYGLTLNKYLILKNYFLNLNIYLYKYLKFIWFFFFELKFDYFKIFKYFYLKLFISILNIKKINKLILFENLNFNSIFLFLLFNNVYVLSLDYLILFTKLKINIFLFYNYIFKIYFIYDNFKSNN